MKVFLDLFIEFFQIGLFAVGGGPATIPFLMDIPDRHTWYTRADVVNMLAVSESTPGPIGINMATYAGFSAAGVPGGIVATFSLVLPSLIVIILVAKILEKISTNPYVKSAFSGIRPLVTGLIATAVYSIFQTALFTAEDGSFQILIPSAVLCVILFALMNVKKLKKIHPFFWMVAGAAAGIIFKM